MAAAKWCPMSEKVWSRETIVDALISLYDSGVPLRSGDISSSNVCLHSAIYYSWKGKPAYFGTLESAREAVAARLRGYGRLEDAEAVIRLNGPRQSPNKFSADDWKSRRRELVRELKGKIAADEDVRYRRQQETDHTFVSMCCRAFGQYQGVFAAAGLKYEDYASHLKRGGDYYLNELIKLIVSGRDLGRDAVSSENPRLVGRLSHISGGYYSALKAAASELKKSGKLSHARRADPEKWRMKSKKEAWERQAKEKRENLEKIVDVWPRKYYSGRLIPGFWFEGRAIGSDIMAMLEGSDEWVTVSDIAEKLGFSPCNVRMRMHHFAGCAVRYHQGRRVKYFFHSSAAGSYTRKYPSRLVRNSTAWLARRLGVPYTKVRSLLSIMGIEAEEAGKKAKVLSESQAGIVSQVIAREKRLLCEIREKVIPSEGYTCPQMEAMGIPTSYFLRGIRSGSVQFEQRGNARVISGKTVLEYFNNSPGCLRLSQGLRLISYFNPHLYTVSDMVAILGEYRTDVFHRLYRLLEEAPNSCFRIRKSETRSRILANDNVLRYISDWGSRAELQLLSRLGISGPAGEKEAVEAAGRLESMIQEDGSIPPALAMEALKDIRVIRQSGASPVKIAGTVVSRKDLVLVHRYMASNDYKWLDMGERISLGDLADAAGSLSISGNSLDVKSRAEFGIYRGNMGLVFSAINRMGLNFQAMALRGVNEEMLVDAGMDAVLNSISTYDPHMGKAKFSTYAYIAIKHSIWNALKKRRISASSLSAPLRHGEDKSLADIIEGDSPGEAHDELDARELKESVAKLMKCLSARERKVLSLRYGFGGNERHTLEEVGKKIGLTREGARLIEEKSLNKMRANVRLVRQLEGWLD